LQSQACPGMHPAACGSPRWERERMHLALLDDGRR